MIKEEDLIPLDEYLPYQIDYTANFNKSFRREFQVKYVSTEISADEMAIFYCIYFNPKMSQSEMAKFLFKGKAHVGKILNDMEERGLIKRIADTRDNIIIKRNEITPKGMVFLEKGYNETDRIKNAMKKEFSQDEIDNLISYLKRYRKILNSLVDVKLK